MFGCLDISLAWLVECKSSPLAWLAGNADGFRFHECSLHKLHWRKCSQFRSPPLALHLLTACRIPSASMPISDAGGNAAILEHVDA